MCSILPKKAVYGVEISSPRCIDELLNFDADHVRDKAVGDPDQDPVLRCRAGKKGLRSSWITGGRLAGGQIRLLMFAPFAGISGVGLKPILPSLKMKILNKIVGFVEPMLIFSYSGEEGISSLVGEGVAPTTVLWRLTPLGFPGVSPGCAAGRVRGTEQR